MTFFFLEIDSIICIDHRQMCVSWFPKVGTTRLIKMLLFRVPMKLEFQLAKLDFKNVIQFRVPMKLEFQLAKLD